MALGVQASIMNNSFSFPFAKLFQGPRLPASEPVTHSSGNTHAAQHCPFPPVWAAATQPAWHVLYPLLLYR